MVGKLLGGDKEAFGHEGRDRADMRFVEVEDGGAAGGLWFVGDGARAKFESAAAGAGHGAAGGGIVEEVDGLLTASASEVEGEQGAEFDGGAKAAFERFAAAGEGLEAGGGPGGGPELFGGDEAGFARLILGEAGDPEEGEEIARLAHGGEHGGEEGVGDGGGLADGGEALEGKRIAHGPNPPGGGSSPSGWSTQSSNLAKRSRKRNSMVPVGPLRCLATMTWATPWG